MKIIYQKTFDNILTEKYDKNFPVEDQFFSNSNVAVVADGITRDPINIEFEVALKNPEIGIKYYPRPSGGELAAKEVTKIFKNYFNGNLKDTLILANQKIKILNDKSVSNCDYLQNDYYGTVASCVYIENKILHYSYICDCGVIVYNKNGDIKFQTDDELEKFTRPFLEKIPYPWTDDRCRVITRRDYRNNLKMLNNNQCVSYGALTGEKDAEFFIREGTFKLEKDDIIIVYSDGFFNFLKDIKFIKLILNFNCKEFEEFVLKKSNENYELYGKEKTLIIIKEED